MPRFGIHRRFSQHKPDCSLAMLTVTAVNAKIFLDMPGTTKYNNTKNSLYKSTIKNKLIVYGEMPCHGYSVYMRRNERRSEQRTMMDCGTLAWVVFFLIFVFAPYLSTSMGDFWSSAVFLPFWGLVYLSIRLIRKYVVVPRIGVVTFGKARKTKLMKFSLIMLIINVVAFMFGIVAARNAVSIAGRMHPFMLSLAFLSGFSIAAYFLDFNRLYLYGLLVGVSPLAGEWLYTTAHAAHHGFPITFGATSGIMILVGLTVFVRLLRNNTLPLEGYPSEEA